MDSHKHFMSLALAQAEKALAEGEFPVGCVFVIDNHVVAQGRRKNSSGDHANEIDHAEVTALRQLLQALPQTDCRGITVYSTMEPCLMCYSTMLLSGIRRFVWAYEDVMGGGTNLQLAHLNELYAEMQVEIIPHFLRRESLALFQKFFRSYTYWQGSRLAEYTLAQPLESQP
jgi:tRNA(adenine34) deaminase